MSLIAKNPLPASFAAAEWRVEKTPLAYPEAVRAMEERVAAIEAGTAPELFWLVEHPPVYTSGTSASPDELKNAARFPVFETGRGGRYTYHGPGQRVIYVLCDLRKRDRDVRRHVCRLEEWVIRTLGDFDIKGERREGRVGIWVENPGAVAAASEGAQTKCMAGGTTGAERSRINVGEEKIAAIGVRVRRWITYHGLALNVMPDLSHYDGIVPCGLPQFGVTSMHALGIKAAMAEVDRAFRRHAPELFGL